MDQTIRKALYLTAIALGLAFVFNILFFEKLIGISVAIMAGALLCAVFLFGFGEKLSVRKSWWVVMLIAFFALMPAVRANEFLTFLNVCATFGLLMLLAHELAGTPAFILKLRDYFLLIPLGILRMLKRGASTLALIGRIRSDVRRRDTWLRIFKGVLMAVPLLVIFGILFSHADLAFSQFVKSFVDITVSERTIQYAVLLALAFAASLSFLSYIFFPKRAEPKTNSEKPETGAESGRGIETLVFLGLIAALFLTFIGFQVTYLFGGEANIAHAGFTYAEYARRGFWELLGAGALSLFVLLVFEKYSGAESKKEKRFLVPALILIAEVGVIIASAFKRLSLYIDAYGMTLQRFYAAALITLLLALFVLLAIKFLRSKREQFFAFGALLSIAMLLIAVNAVNPDAFIARFNMVQYAQTGKIDVPHMGELSADAEPWKIELYGELANEEKQVLQGMLQKDRDELQKNNADWQSANLSRAEALKRLEKLEY